MRIQWDPEALTDLDEAASYLEKQQIGLGRQLLSRVKETEQRIRADPSSYEKVRRNVHRCRVKQFSYSMYFAVESESVLILALAHHSRRSNYWQHRFPDDQVSGD